MKQFFTVLLCLLLCGCAAQSDAAPTAAVPEAQVPPAQAALYAPDHPLEKAYPGEIRAYPLSLRKVHGMLALGADVLTLSGSGSTTLTVLTGTNLEEAARLTVDFELFQEDPSLKIHESGVSFFDPLRQETVILDNKLRELRRIAAPPGLSGQPILSSDAKKLYYCTPWSVVAWDLETGIRRTIKELAYSSQELTGLHRNEEILECHIRHSGESYLLLLSSIDGRELDTLPENTMLKANGSGYFTALPDGFQTLLIFSGEDTMPNLLLPKQPAARQYYLEKEHAAVTVRTSEEAAYLDYYDLRTGILRNSLTLEELQIPKSIISTQARSLFILVYDPAADCDVLYRWDVAQQAPDSTDPAAYTAAYHSPENPDLDALEQCRRYADSIGEKYGISIRIWEDACLVQPWDYQFRPEHLAPVLQKELQLLDQRLSCYPEEILQQTISHFTGLTVCLVREISGTADTDSLRSATGIQFFDQDHAYVAITTGKYSQQALYHELYHVMETHILTESTALDQWERLNPSGFAYGSPQDVYLQGQTRAFVDSYSMRYLKEDRARVLEHAMLPGKKDVFQSEYMQRKLTAVCQGIREAYKLKNKPEALPWEQYLVTPLTPEE